MRFCVMTYNIHKGIGGLDRRYRLDRVVDTIRHYAPDILMLQEVDDGAPRSRREEQVHVLGEALDMPHRVYQPNVRLRQGRYGNALISRFPLTDACDLDLTVPFKKRRRAQAMQCRISSNGHTRTLVVCNFHLGLAGFERRIQMRRFLRSDILEKRHRRTPIIAAGDMNDGRQVLHRELLLPAGFQLASGKVKTFPAYHPLRPLDQILFRGDIRLVKCYSAALRVARQASDHLPLVGEFELID